MTQECPQFGTKISPSIQQKSIRRRDRHLHLTQRLMRPLYRGQIEGN